MTLSRAHKYPLSVTLLHAAVALALLSTLVVGYLLDDNEQLLTLHRSLGIAVMFLVAVRIVNRFVQRSALPASVNPVQSLPYLAEKTVHGLLYLLMLGLPLLGWLKTSASGHPARFFGLFDLPALVGKSHHLSYLFGQAHAFAAAVFVAVLAMHVAGALAHVFWHKENIFKRITP